MRMRDRDKSTLALYFVWAAYRNLQCNAPYKMEVFSAHNAKQYFSYDSLEDLEADLDIINAFVSSREI